MSTINKSTKVIFIIGIILIGTGLLLPFLYNKDAPQKKEEQPPKKENYNFNGIEYTNINILKGEQNTIFQITAKNVRPVDAPKQEIKITFQTEKKEIIWEAEITIPELKKDEVKELEYEYLGDIIPDKYEIKITRNISSPVSG